jgi:hypothetical protein
VNRIKVHAIQNWAMDGVEIFIHSHDDMGRLSYATNIEMKDLPEGYLPQDEARIVLREEDAKILMNELWNTGIRPSEQRDRSETLNAKDQHINDLRKVLDAFIQLKEK